VTENDVRLAAKLRGFGPLGVAASLLVLLFGPILEPLNSLPALAWIHYSRTPWSEVGLVRPRSWLATIAGGALFGAGLKLLFKSLVMPLFGAPAINAEYHYLYGNTAELPSMMIVVLFGAGFGEELVYRGFLYERLGKLWGRGPLAKTAIVVVTSLLFGAIHYPVHGIYSAIQATLDGAAFGTVFAITGRLWPLIVAHASFDVTAVLIIYFGWEERLAGLFLR